MKIEKIIFTATGEVRLPKRGEWFSNNTNYCKAIGDFTDSQYPIYTMEVITENWKPKEDEYFLYVDYGGEVAKSYRDSSGSRWQNDIIAIGNCFPDTPEGEKQAQQKSIEYKNIYK